MTEVENIADEILREWLGDWVPLDTLIWSAREVAEKSERDFKNLTIDVLHFLLSEGLALVETSVATDSLPGRPLRPRP